MTTTSSSSNRKHAVDREFVLGKAALYLAMFVAAVLAVRLVGDALERDATRVVTRTKFRVEQFLEYFSRSPDHARGVVLFAGASDVETAIDPILIDQLTRAKGLHLTSYDVGFRNFDPRLIGLFARRVGEIARNKDIEINSVILKFPSGRISQRFYESVRVHIYRHFEDIRALLYSWEMIKQDFPSRPGEMAQVIFQKYFLNHRSSPSFAELIFKKLESWLDPLRLGGEPTVSRKVAILTDDVWGGRMYRFAPDWDEAQRGGSLFGYPEHPEAIEEISRRYAAPGIMEQYLRNQVYTSDVLRIRLNPEGIADAQLAVAYFHRYAKRVAIYLSPASPYVVGRTENLPALFEMARQIARPLNTPTLNYWVSKVDFLDRDFFDGIHLRESGREKLGKLLAEDLVRLNRSP